MDVIVCKMQDMMKKLMLILQNGYEVEDDVKTIWHVALLLKMFVWQSSSYEISIFCAHSWFVFSPFHFPSILEFFEIEESTMDDGHVMMFKHWVLEDSHVIVVDVDPLRWAIYLSPYIHIYIFTLFLFAHQSITRTLGSCVSSFHVGNKSFVSCESKISYHVFHVELRRRRRSNPSLFLSHGGTKKNNNVPTIFLLIHMEAIHLFLSFGKTNPLSHHVANIDEEEKKKTSWKEILCPMWKEQHKKKQSSLSLMWK